MIFVEISGHELRAVWRRSKLKNKVWHSSHKRHICTFDRCAHGCTSQKSFLASSDTKKENWRTTKLFLRHVSLTLSMGKKIKENFLPTGSRENRSLGERHLIVISVMIVTD